MSALSFETALPHPLLQHVQRDAVHSGINPKPMTEPFRTAMWRIWQACLDHDAFDDLPDARTAQWPDRRPCFLAGLLASRVPWAVFSDSHAIWPQSGRFIADNGWWNTSGGAQKLSKTLDLSAASRQDSTHAALFH